MTRYLALAAVGGFLAGLAGLAGCPDLAAAGPAPCEVAPAPREQPPAVEAFSPSKQPVSPDGTRATVDLPAGRHVRNTGGMGRRGPGSGAGLCVFTSGQMAGDWHNIADLAGFQRWMTTRPGGGTPTKFDAMLKAYFAEMGKPAPEYVRNTDGDVRFLETALKTGRMLCVTYAGADDFYSGPIAHMVNLVHLDPKWACIVDNNRPGSFVWMARTQFLNRYRGLYDSGRPMTIQGSRVGGDWAYCFLAPPPPPHPAPPADDRMAVGEAAGAPPAGDNFGIDLEGMKAERKGSSINGEPVSREQAIQAMLTDDSSRLSLVGVGDAAACDAVRRGLALLDPADRDRVHVTCYAPDQWQVGQFRLRPGVTLRGAAAGPVGSPRVAGDLGHVGAPTAESVRKLVADTLHPPQPMPPPVLPPAPTSTPDPVPVPAPAPPGGRELPWWVMLLGSAALAVLAVKMPALAAAIRAVIAARLARKAP